MSTAGADMLPSDAGSTDSGIAETERVTATVNSEGGAETGLFTATVTDAAVTHAGFANVSETDEITATVTSGAQHRSDTPNVAEFMSAVVAWPKLNDPGYVNLHYSLVNPRDNKGPLLKGLGWPFRDVGKFVARAAWFAGTNQFKDVWFCTSLQSAMKKNTKGKPKAVRFAVNALKVKAIWIDIDVDPNDPKKYPTIEEALKATLLFQRTVGLPEPSAIVKSGGGLHVYWISDVALTPDDWKPYAHGLKTLLLQHGVKCDSGLTTDRARILRVPGTLNHKYDPPKLVELLNLPLTTYDFADKLSFLTQIAPQPRAAPGTAAPQPSLFVDGVTAETFGKPAFTIAGPDFNAGIEKHADTLLKAEPIVDGCGFLREALLTGGKEYDGPITMLGRRVVYRLRNWLEVQKRQGRRNSSVERPACFGSLA